LGLLAGFSRPPNLFGDTRVLGDSQTENFKYPLLSFFSLLIPPCGVSSVVLRRFFLVCDEFERLMPRSLRLGRASLSPLVVVNLFTCADFPVRGNSLLSSVALFSWFLQFLSYQVAAFRPLPTFQDLSSKHPRVAIISPCVCHSAPCFNVILIGLKPCRKNAISLQLTTRESFTVFPLFSQFFFNLFIKGFGRAKDSSMTQ